LLAVHVVPVKGCEAIAGHYAVRNHSRQHSTAAAGDQLHAIISFYAETRSIFRVHFNKWTGIKFVEGGNLAGLGERVPLVLQSAGIQNPGIIIIRQLSGWQPGTRPEYGFARRCGEVQPRALALACLTQVLADAG